MLFIACGLMGGSALAEPCDDYARAVDKYIQAIRQSGQKLDQATDAHQFADAVNVFTSATEELTATLRELGPQVTALYQNPGNASVPACNRAQEKLVSFGPELNAIGTKFAEQAQKYISDPEVQQAFDRLRKLRFNGSDRALPRPGSRFVSSTRKHGVISVGRWATVPVGGRYCGASSVGAQSL
jgi:NAD-dependent DNA ligase